MGGGHIRELSVSPRWANAHSCSPGNLHSTLRGRKVITVFFFLIFIYLYLFLSVLGLRFCARAFSSCGNGVHSSSRCAGLSPSRPLLLQSTGSRRAGSAAVAHGPSCSAACGIFPDQGSNSCPLHWQADSQPLRHQGSPIAQLFNILDDCFFYLSY